MISRLKDSGLFTLVLVVLLAFAIRIPALWYLPSVGTISTPGILAPMVLGLNAWPVVSVLVSLLMVIAQAFLINEIARSHGLLKPVGYLPAYFFILLQSIYPENLLITEYHFGNFCVFIGLLCLLKLRL